MAVNYNDLWKLLIDKKMNKSELCKLTGISSSTMAKLTKEEHVAMPVLEKICAVLDCNIADVMCFTDLDKVREEMEKQIAETQSIFRLKQRNL